MAKSTPDRLSFSPQRGTPGHCFVAQVWGPDGRSLAHIDPTDDPAVASAYACLFAAAPDMRAAIEGVIFDIPVGSRDAPCHRGLTTREKCGRCSRADALYRAIAKAQGK